MNLLKSILEIVTEKLLDICDVFVKGCEPDSWGKLREWFDKPSTPTRDIDPVVPFGGF